MKKKGQLAGLVVGGVVAVLVAVAMLPVLASLIDEAQKLVSSEEQLTNTEFNSSFTLVNNDIVASSVVITNATCGPAATCTTNNATLRRGFEYRLNLISGVLIIVNRTGTWNVSYDSEPDTYVDNASGRTVIQIVTLMYGVGLILIALSAAGIFLTRR